jgi:predicted NUDIX family NTP pyrophosphohydrolase
MPKESAGLLIYRHRAGAVQYLLVHPGGPLWKSKDLGAWTLPKGEIQSSEDPLTAAQREVREELGFCPTGAFIPLSPIRQKGGKLVRAWAIEADWDTATLCSNTFKLAWPPRSGKLLDFPEVDRAEYFDLAIARTKINPAQVPLLDELERRLTYLDPQDAGSGKRG